MFNNNNNNVFTNNYGGSYKDFIKTINISTKADEIINVNPNGKITLAMKSMNKEPENSNQKKYNRRRSHDNFLNTITYPITNDDKEKVDEILGDSRRKKNKYMTDYKELETEFKDKPVEDIDGASLILDQEILDNDADFSGFGEEINKILQTAGDYIEDYKKMIKISKQYERFSDKGAKFKEILETIKQQKEKVYKMFIEEKALLLMREDLFYIDKHPWRYFKALVKGMDLVFISEEFDNKIDKARKELEKIRKLKEKYKVKFENEREKFKEKEIDIKNKARNNFYRIKELKEKYEEIFKREKNHFEELMDCQIDAEIEYCNSLGKAVRTRKSISKQEFEKIFKKEYERIKEEFEKIQDQYAQCSCCTDCTIF